MYDEKEFKKMLEMDFLGYKIKDLVTATFLLKKAGIEAEEIKDCEKATDELSMNKDLIHRSLNVGFSGGEKKKNEVLQIKLLKPSFIILDELDSGLDVDSLRTVCENLKKYMKDNPDTSMLIITHYSMILEYLKPDYVHILSNKHIVKTGNYKIVADIEKNGYQKYIGDDVS